MGGFDDLSCWRKWSLPWGCFWKWTWGRREVCGGKWFPFEVFVIAWIFVGVPYVITNNIAYLWLDDTFAMFPESPWDREIPVIPWMMAPYCGLYFFYPAVIALAPHTDKGRMEMMSMMQMLMTATFFCSFFFLVMPAEIDMRDEIDWGAMSPFETAMFKFVHEGDHPWNAWPSLHVIHSYLIARTMTMWCRTDYLNHWLSKPFLAVLWTEWVLLVFSTMTTKQHYIWDACSGLVVGLTLWKLWEGTYKFIDAKGPDAVGQYLGWGLTLKTSIQAVRLTDWPSTNNDDHIDNSI